LQTALLTDHFVHPICIATPFAVGDVFCYLIVDEKVVLVDCGQYTDEAFEYLKRQFKEQGLKLSDLDEIWLTHGHPDHFGQVRRLVEQSGAQVYGHSKERANFSGNDDGDLFEDFFNCHHIPSRMIDNMVEQLDWLQRFQQPVEPEWVEEGDKLSSGALTVTVKHTPGHAPGHLVFVSDQGVLFGGDLLLSHISTNALINFDPDTGRRNQSLLQYRKSLQWIREQEEMVLPGHGKIIQEIPNVANHHLSEHEQRYKRIQQMLAEAPKGLLEISMDMFPEAIKEGAIFLVLSEVIGYLDWGLEEGTIQVEESKMIYRAVQA
jgi:glyoxylase-like metal-dependent hydrolase (beta-lactamase superfamily II)